MRLTTLLLFVLGLALGAAAALYFYCPVLCKKGVHQGIAGVLGKLGLPQADAEDLSNLLPI